MALKPASKRVTITDESVNSYGFWTRSAGIDLSMYTENPILLWMHKRATEQLPIGVIQDLKVETDGSITGLPAFDDTDDYAMKLYNKYEAGILNMVSAGFCPTEVQTESKFLKGNAPCLSKCELNEVSLVDIGANKKAHKVKLYNKGEMLNLTNSNDLLKLFNDNNADTMIIIPKSITELLKLTDNATEADVLTALKKQAEVVVNLTSERDTANKSLKDLQEATAAAKVVSLVDKAVSEGKITAAQKEAYVKLANADYGSVEGIFNGMTKHVTLQQQLGGDTGENAAELAELVKLSGDQLFKNGKLDRLKELSMPQFRLKYKEATGADYAEETK